MVMLLIALLLVFQLSKLIYFFVDLILTGNVTDTNFVWESGKEIEHIVAYLISGIIGISISWMVGTFIWTSSWNLSKEFLNLFIPNDKLLSKQTSPLEILSAIYKTDNAQVDITPVARQMVLNNKLKIRASNELAGDPDPGVAKILIISYRIGRKTSEIKAGEGDTVSIPEL
jgi:hypothetical protein